VVLGGSAFGRQGLASGSVSHRTVGVMSFFVTAVLLARRAATGASCRLFNNLTSGIWINPSCKTIDEQETLPGDITLLSLCPHMCPSSVRVGTT
jgi:hypothetical protein